MMCYAAFSAENISWSSPSFCDRDLPTPVHDSQPGIAAEVAPGNVLDTTAGAVQVSSPHGTLAAPPAASGLEVHTESPHKSTLKVRLPRLGQETLGTILQDESTRVNNDPLPAGSHVPLPDQKSPLAQYEKETLAASTLTTDSDRPGNGDQHTYARTHARTHARAHTRRHARTHAPARACHTRTDMHPCKHVHTPAGPTVKQCQKTLKASILTTDTERLAEGDCPSPSKGLIWGAHTTTQEPVQMACSSMHASRWLDLWACTQKSVSVCGYA